MYLLIGCGENINPLPDFRVRAAIEVNTCGLDHEKGIDEFFLVVKTARIECFDFGRLTN